MPVYLYLILFTVFFPLVLSFDRRVRFIRQWKYLFPAITIVATVFLVWDYYFTLWGVWGFNQEYLWGPHLANLPIEEVSFFIVVPFACVFLYEVFRHYLPQDYLAKPAPYISGLLIVLFVATAILNWGAYYTTVTFASTALLLFLVQYVLKVKWMGWFYLGYLVSLVPFLVVNGILTALPVVWYNDAHNLGIRLYTIPLDDTVYCMLLLLGNITIYEFFRSRATH